LLSFSVVILAGYAVFGRWQMVKIPPSAKLPDRYEFTSDWVSYNVRHWEEVLSSMKDKPNIQALEVGSFEGRSALWFLENVLTGPGSTITCVDIFGTPVVEARFNRNIAASGVSNKVTKLKARSDEALKQFKPGSFDFIYIDGSHVAKDVLVDAVLGWELLKPGGVLIFDDYEWDGYGSRVGQHKKPKLAINALLAVYGPYLEVLHKKYQLSLRKKDTVDLDDDGAVGRFARKLQLLLD
jgi:Methyltransferase domain